MGPSVGPSVGPYVRPLALRKNRRGTHLIVRPGLLLEYEQFFKCQYFCCQDSTSTVTVMKGRKVKNSLILKLNVGYYQYI